jgi:hypothetical protein
VAPCCETLLLKPEMSVPTIPAGPISTSQQGASPSRIHRFLSHAGPPLLLLALTIAVFWKIVFTDQFTWLNSPDLSEQVMPWFQEEAVQLRQGHFPIWDPHHWAGQSLLGQDQPGVLFPLNWLLWLMPFWNGHIALPFLNWYFVLIHFFAAWFGYLLARDLGLSSFASICAGSSFGFSGYMGNTDWPQMLNGGIWAPLVLLFALRALNGCRPFWNMGIAGAVAGFAFYGGHHQIPSYTLLSVGFLVLFYIVFRDIAILRGIALGLTCLILAVLVGAPQLLPSYEYWSRALRWVNAANPMGFEDKVPYIVFGQYSFNPAAILGLIVPNYSPNVTPFVGLTVLVFAILAVTANWRTRMAPPFVALALAGLFVSIGKYSVFHGVLYSVLPLLNKSRNAAFAMFILDLSLAILAGFGIDYFLQQREQISRQIRIVSNVLLSMGALLLVLLLARGMFQGEKMFESTFYALLALSAILLACVFLSWELGRLPMRAALLSVLGLILFEIGSVTSSNYFHREQGWRYLDRLSAYDDVASFLRQQPGNFRILRNSDDIGFNFGDWYGIDEYTGIGAGMTRNIASIHGAGSIAPLLGVGYYVGHEPQNSDPEPVFRGRAGVNVYRVPGALPRAWPVHSIEAVEDSRQVAPHINAPIDQLAMKTFMVGSNAPKLDSCGGIDAVRVSRIDVTDVEIEASMACQGMVVVGNNFFPGWRARVDGTPTQIYEAYSFLQGVVVPSGRHRIRLHYVPLSLYQGLAMAAFGLVLLALIQRRDS